MNMLWHDHVPNYMEFIFLTDFFKDIQEQISAGRRAKKWFSVVATTRDVVEISTSVEPAPSFGHGGNFILRSNVRGWKFVYPPFAAAISRVYRTDFWPQRMGHPRCSEGQKKTIGSVCSCDGAPDEDCEKVAVHVQVRGDFLNLQ
jgi:hypothetical protein